MEDKKILERFSALYDLVVKAHDSSKKEQDVLTLIDTFAEHNSLALAFQEDCNTYLPSLDPSPQLCTVLNEIHSILSCSANHIQQHASYLRTPIIGHFIKQMTEPRTLPN